MRKKYLQYLKNKAKIWHITGKTETEFKKQFDFLQIFYMEFKNWKKFKTNKP